MIINNLFSNLVISIRLFCFLLLSYFCLFYFCFASKTEFYTQDDVLNVVVDTDSGTQISIKSEKINLSTSFIEWYLGGEKLLSGQNKYIFFSKNKISNKKIKVIITDQDNKNYEVEFDLSGNNLFLYWEAVNSTTPLWWQGKAQVAYGNQVRIWAVTDIYDDFGKIMDNRDLNYTWYIDDVYNEKKSGFGKEVADVYIGLNTYSDTKIRVVIKFKSGEIAADKTIIIKNTDTEMALYKQVLEKSDNPDIIGEYAFDFVFLKNFDYIYEKNFNLVLEPMFFGVADKNSLKYSWTINNQKSNSIGFVNNIIINPSTYGDFNINLIAVNPANQDEYSEKKIRVTIK